MNPIELDRGDNFKGLSTYLHSGKREISSEEVLAKITDKQSVFGVQDIQKHVEHDEVTRVLGDDQIVILDSGESSEGVHLYTTKEMITTERDMMQRVVQMKGKTGFGVSNSHVKDAIETTNAELMRQGGALSAEQITAIEHVTDAAQIVAVSGKAGTGKSTMLAAARRAWEAQGYRVYGAALAGKAAEELQAAAGIESRTLASYTRAWSQGYGQLEDGDVLVIDEAGMIGSRQMAGFIREAQDRGAKVVLIGDEEQLQAINAGAAFRTILERTDAARLDDVRRQKDGWQQQASRDFASQQTTKALEAYEAHGAIQFEATGQAARHALVKAYAADRQANPYKSRLALAHRREDVRLMNTAIRQELKDQGIIVGQDTPLKTRDGLREFAGHDRLVFLENNRDMGVKNGTVAFVLAVTQDQIDVQFADGRQLAFNPKDYTAFDHGYAMTMHKAQGVTVDRTFVYATRSMDRHMTYVAMTRHRDGAQMFVDRTEMINTRSLTKNISNAGLKSSTLDFVEHADQQRESRTFNAAAAKPQKNRVGWSMAMNVGQVPPEAAWKVMQSTADSAALLKQANGIKAGKACEKPVYHYSITWPEADAPSHSVQKQAVRESLIALRLHNHEAIAVQHLDGVPHVHVMVNLVHPETGMSASTAVEQANGKKASKLSNSHKKLRSWANAFERTHGLQITEGSALNAHRRRQGENVNARRKNRTVYEREKRESREAMMGWFIKQQAEKGRNIGVAQRGRQAQRASTWRDLFGRFASTRMAKDTSILNDFITAAQQLKQAARADRQEERQAWRRYGTERATAFNDVVQGATEDASQHQSRAQEIGFGLSQKFQS